MPTVLSPALQQATAAFLTLHLVLFVVLLSSPVSKSFLTLQDRNRVLGSP